MRFAKGHGTGNDFVLYLDPDGTRPPTATGVRALADRRRGIGADGVIRAVPLGALPAGVAGVSEQPADTWFMDYWNADGTVAEMCGNGVRVFAEFLGQEGVADVGGRLAVATRAGMREVTRAGQHGYAVDMGGWRFTEPERAVSDGFDTAVVVDGLPGGQRVGLSVDLGNPHVVVMLSDPAELAALDLSRAPRLDPAPRAGANVEFVVPGTDGTASVTMRVHERGVGETASCGTGACAAALAARWWAGAASGPDRWTVDVPGGRLWVTADEETVVLTGPATIVAVGETTLSAWTD